MGVGVGDIIRAVVSYEISGGSIAQNVFWYIFSGTPDTDAAVLTALENFFEGGWLTAIDSLMNANSDLLLLEADIINPNGTVESNIGSTVLTGSGTGAVDALPPGNAAFMQAETTEAKSKGRKYIPGLDEGVVSSGILLAAGLTALADAFDEWLTGLGTAGGGTLTPGVLSRTLQTFEIFTGGGFITDVVAYQRRRKPNVGS